MSVFYNFALNNNTSERILLDKLETRTTPILVDAGKYDLSIVKFDLPATEIESFVIDDDTSYVITHSCLVNENNGSDYAVVEYSQPMYQSSVNKMYNIQHFMENFGRSSALAFRGLLTALNPYCGNVITKTQTSSSTNLGTVGHFDITFDFSTGITPATLFASYIKLDCNIRGTTTKQNLELVLIDPNGVECIITANKQFTNRMITFEDGSIFNQAGLYNNAFVESDYQPIETLSILTRGQTTQKGNWKLRVFNKNTSDSLAFNVTYDVSLTVYFSPFTSAGQSNIIRAAPTIDFEGGGVRLLYDENLPRCGYQLQLSPKLYEVLGFTGTRNSAGRYSLWLPQTQINDDGEYFQVVYPQPVNSSYKLIDLAEIQIRSANLSGNAEINVTTNEPILSSINVDSTDLDNNIYQFYNTNLNDRAYSLNLGGSLIDVHLAVWVRYRSNNKVRQVYLPPYSTFNCLLKFIKHE